MGRRASFNTAEAILRRIREGRGQGEGSHFQPWTRVKDVSSLGRRHLVFSPKFDRVFHLLSDLEARGLFASECIYQAIGNREQFPHLPLSRTRAIAARLRLKHPRAPGAQCDHVIATDQLWTLKLASGTYLLPLFIKYTDKLDDERVQAKRSIEERSWAEWESAIPVLPLADFTEFTVNQTFVANWSLIRDTLRSDYFDSFPKRITKRVHDCAFSLAHEGAATLNEVAEYAANKLRLPQAQVLTAIHYLIASMAWPVDLEGARFAPSSPLKMLSEVVA